jgi:hypothetical protein
MGNSSKVKNTTVMAEDFRVVTLCSVVVDEDGGSMDL